MKVLYFHQNFKTPGEGGLLRSYYFTTELARKNVSVTLITSHNHKEKLRKDVDGVDVIYLPVYYENKLTFLQRITSFFKYVWLACIESNKVKDVDICYVMTTPLTTGFIALYNKFFLGRKYIFEIGDLWPLVPVEMGVLRNSLSNKFWYWFEKICYRRAAANIALSPPIKTYVEDMAPQVPIDTLENVSDCKYFGESTDWESWRSKHQMDGKFVISYLGTFGVANDLLRFPEFAMGIRDLPIQFVFAGEGMQKSSYQEKIESMNLDNVEVLDLIPKSEVREVLGASDAVLISFADFESLHTGCPNKLFDGLAAGKLIITNFGGWVEELIVENECGFSFDANQPDDFRNKMQPFIDDLDLLHRYQENARKLAIAKFDLPSLSKRQYDFIQKIVNR